MEELYREQILEHYKRPHNWGELDEFDVEFEDFNPSCGDQLKVQMKIDDGVVAKIGFSGHGCAISQASASMMSDEVLGMKVDDLIKLDRQAVLDLLGIEITATRRKCALLSLKVIRSAGLGTSADWDSDVPDAAAPADGNRGSL
jgi:nitrogen fixation NifU-like protein